MAVVHERRAGLVVTTRDVNEGRAVLSFSEWQRPQEADLQEVVDVIRGKRHAADAVPADPLRRPPE